MRIDISHEDVTGFQLGTFGLAYILAKVTTGVPQVDAWIQTAESLSFFLGLLAGYYDNGKGFSVISPLYIPCYAVSY